MPKSDELLERFIDRVVLFCFVFSLFFGKPIGHARYWPEQAYNYQWGSLQASPP